MPDTPRDAPPPPSQTLHGPFAKLIGYEMSEWDADHATIVLTVEEQHINRSGVLHGGVLATIIDTACGFAGCYQAPPLPCRRAMTLTLHTQFIGPAEVGARLSATARRTGGGRQIFFSSCEVRDQDRRLIARGDGTFRYRTGS
jgi:uncharacterized protein (TIGR00369 family)